MFRAGNNGCDHYLDVCCGIAQSRPQSTARTTRRPSNRRTTSLTPRRIPTSTETNRPNQGGARRVTNRPCGIRNSQGIDFRITGNTNDEAEYGEFPWIVALIEKDANQNERFSFCGGSLITPNVVLTAAHCVQT